MFVGCKKSPEEMVVGEWKYKNSGNKIKFHADGKFEEESRTRGEGTVTKMGEWRITPMGQIQAITKVNGNFDKTKWFTIDGPSKLLFVYFDDNPHSARSRMEEVSRKIILYRVVD